MTVCKKQNYSPDIHPMVLERFKSFKPNSRISKDTTFFVDEMIGPESMNAFYPAITPRQVSEFLDKANGEDVTIMINSPGGYTYDGIAIYNLLMRYDGLVKVEILGWAASAASMIAMAGDEIKIAPSGFVMIHRCRGNVVGNADDLRDEMETCLSLDKSTAELYANRTGLAVDVVEKYMSKDYLMNADHAIDLGFADNILDYTIVEDVEENVKSKIDRKLAKAGLSRSERRRLYAELADTQNAVEQGNTQNAVVKEMDNLLLKLFDLKQMITKG